jgi:hypothetical protein
MTKAGAPKDPGPIDTLPTLPLVRSLLNSLPRLLLLLLPLVLGPLFVWRSFGMVGTVFTSERSEAPHSTLLTLIMEFA